MKTKPFLPLSKCFLALLLPLWGLTGCYTPTAVDRHFGQAMRDAQMGQTVNLSRTVQPDRSRGTDAGIVRSGIVRYEKTYITPASPVTSLDQSLGMSTNTAPR